MLFRYYKNLKKDNNLRRRTGKNICKLYSGDLCEKGIEEASDLTPEEIGGYWDSKSQTFISNDDESEEIYPEYYVTYRQWDSEINDHVYITEPNYDFAPEFLKEKGLEQEFLCWLKTKHDNFCRRKVS